MESKLQWMAITFTAIGLLSSTYYSTHSLKAARIENELSCYLQLNEQYNKLLFKLIESDSEIFKTTDEINLKANKYVIYELFELFYTIKSIEICYQELHKVITPQWEKRLAFLLSKPAIQLAWQTRRAYADKIYDPVFVDYIETILAYQYSQTVVLN